MKLLVTSAFVSMFSLGLLGTGSAFADGVSNGASIKVVGSQVTREISAQTSKQVSAAASQATREAQTR